MQRCRMAVSVHNISCSGSQIFEDIRSLVLDNAEAVDGMPVSLQLVGRRLEEEKVLMMTNVVLQAL